MSVATSRSALDQVQRSAHELTGDRHDYDSLLRFVGNAKYVLLGEASHGTHEFYKARAAFTKRLILEKGFTVLAWEADWPDAFRLNRYIRGQGEDRSAAEALGGFQRFPQWMWRNAEILDLVGWLRAYNDGLPATAPRVGIYGLDLYSLHSSIEAVLGYLEKADPEAAKEARRRYSCFEDFGEDPQSYGLVASADRSLSCEEEVVQQLVDLEKRGAELLKRDGHGAVEEQFYAEQNARVAINAEQYYRAMYRGRPNTWNLRDTHMVDTLDQLTAHLEAHGQKPKAILWAHNSHLGDARATQMSHRGELNVGQLIRQRHPGEGCSVGFTTYSGTVTAASDWGAAAERKRVRPGLEDSYEALFHEVGIANFSLILRKGHEQAAPVPGPLLERAIGVIYRPETERWSHYFDAKLTDQFDAVIHFDGSRALEPLEPTAEWERGEVPETYPSGF